MGIEGQGLSRRSFLKGSMILAAGAAATAGLTGCASGTAEEAPKETFQALGLDDITTWDYETDIVVVGYGGAGSIAAINAADAGSSVILLEKCPADTATEINHTPSSRFNGSRLLCADDAKQAAESIYELSLGRTPMDVCEAMGEGCLTTISYMQSLGAPYPEPTMDTTEIPQIESTHTFGNASPEGFGPAVFRALQENVKSRSDLITVMMETPGKRLIKKMETGEIVGVVAEQADGTTINIKARKAVALTCGGFEGDAEMMENYLAVTPIHFYSNMNNTGDGIKMGLAVGADLWHMNAMVGRAVPYFEEWGRSQSLLSINTKQPNIYVNKYGKRWFYEAEWPSHNAWVEFAHYNSRTLEWDACPAWTIFDATTPHMLRNSYKGYPEGSDELIYWGPEGIDDLEVCVEKGWVLKGETLEELGAKILEDPENDGHMDPAVLAATVERYNQFCAQGKDDDFGKDVEFLVPLSTPPYYAMKHYPGGPNTQGGLRKDASGRVLDPYGNVVKRLYCAGENGSIWGWLYPNGGGNVAENVVFGRIIGAAMAAEEPWEAAPAE